MSSASGSPSRVAWFVLLQATVQAWLRPAVWCPLINRVHSYREVWQTAGLAGSGRDGATAELVDAVIKAVDRLNREKRLSCDWLIGSANRQSGRVIVLNLTAKCKWLDVIDIDLRRGSATAFSTGLLPLLLPLAPLVNLLAFVFPFSDLMTNSKRLPALRVALDIQINDWSVGSADPFQMLFY